MEAKAFSIPGMHCARCEGAVKRELEARSGVTAADVDVTTNTVTVVGEGLHDASLRAAIADAGYEAERAFP
jgi:copper chaperone CopZ